MILDTELGKKGHVAARINGGKYMWVFRDSCPKKAS